MGRICGLGCAELRLGRFLLDGPSLGVPDFLAIGPLGDGMATDRGLGATGADLGSNAGVALVDAAGVGTPEWIVVSIRAIFGRGPADIEASGRTTSVIISSCESLPGTSFAWPVN